MSILYYVWGQSHNGCPFLFKVATLQAPSGAESFIFNSYVPNSSLKFNAEPKASFRRLVNKHIAGRLGTSALTVPFKREQSRTCSSYAERRHCR